MVSTGRHRWRGQSCLWAARHACRVFAGGASGRSDRFLAQRRPSRTVFVTESFIDELAAAKRDPVAYRRALLDKSPRAKAVLDLSAEKAGWGQPTPTPVRVSAKRCA
jgi:hypothetical protein